MIGCEWIEIHIQISANQIPIVIHDQTLYRYSDQAETVSCEQSKWQRKTNTKVVPINQFRAERLLAVMTVAPSVREPLTLRYY